MATTTYAPAGTAVESAEQMPACVHADEGTCAGTVIDWSTWGEPYLLCAEHGDREAERFWTERGA